MHQLHPPSSVALADVPERVISSVLPELRRRELPMTDTSAFTGQVLR